MCYFIYNILYYYNNIIYYHLKPLIRELRIREQVNSAGFQRNCLIIPYLTKSAFLRNVHKNRVKICKLLSLFSLFLLKKCL